ncbi:MAG: sterol desaturase family protein [Spirochaetia bacterium]|nr:sterol desaturase family protein [Spirochaetia bacterium]
MNMEPVLIVIGTGAFLMALERMIPDQKLPHVPGWWIRVILINGIQLFAVLAGGMTWDLYFKKYSIFHLEDFFGKFFSVFSAYLFITFIFYWWHRIRHDCYPLWLLFHQFHHSPSRIETITSFYKHPLEMTVNSIFTGAVVYMLFGLEPLSGAWVTAVTGIGEFIYHMNIKTPRLMGYVFQRPEMHRIHHERSRHYNNFSDLPLWDMLFGTFKNPNSYEGLCGFRPEREKQSVGMLLFKNVNNPIVNAGSKK